MWGRGKGWQGLAFGDRAVSSLNHALPWTVEHFLAVMWTCLQICTQKTKALPRQQQHQRQGRHSRLPTAALNAVTVSARLPRPRRCDQAFFVSFVHFHVACMYIPHPVCLG